MQYYNHKIPMFFSVLSITISLFLIIAFIGNEKKTREASKQTTKYFPVLTPKNITSHASLPTLTELHKETNKEIYSRYQCAGGGNSQNMHIHNWTINHMQYQSFPCNDPRFRVCLFENICRIKEKLVFFQDQTASAEDSDFLPWKGMVHLGYLNEKFEISVEFNRLPEALMFHPTNLFSFQSPSFSNDLGHLLIDDVMPIFTALDMFDIGNLSLQVAFIPPSWQLTAEQVQNADMLTPWLLTKNETLQGEFFFRSWGKYFFDKDVIFANQFPDNICFKNVLVGHNSAFSHHSSTIARAGYLRRFRDHVVNRIVSRTGKLHLCSYSISLAMHTSRLILVS